MTKYQIAERQSIAADKKYNARFDAALYGAATKTRSDSFANALIDDARAICGHPFYRLSYRRWSQAALKFLELFV